MIVLSLPNPNQDFPVIINADAFLSAKVIPPTPNSAETVSKVQLSFTSDEGPVFYEFTDPAQADAMVKALGEELAKGEGSVVDLKFLVSAHGGTALPFDGMN